VAGNRLLREVWAKGLNWVEFGELPGSARLLEIFLDRLAARTVAVAYHLFDPKYEATLLRSECQLRDELKKLASFVEGISSADRQGAAWMEVEQLLSRLGLTFGSGSKELDASTGPLPYRGNWALLDSE
jgi:hypothetical protein